MRAVTITQIDFAELEILIEKSIRRIFRENNSHLSSIEALINDREPKLLTIQQASSFLALSKQTIYGLTSKNQIPFHKKGKRLYFLDQELKDWISNK